MTFLKFKSESNKIFTYFLSKDDKFSENTTFKQIKNIKINKKNQTFTWKENENTYNLTFEEFYNLNKTNIEIKKNKKNNHDVFVFQKNKNETNSNNSNIEEEKNKKEINSKFIPVSISSNSLNSNNKVINKNDESKYNNFKKKIIKNGIYTTGSVLPWYIKNGILYVILARKCMGPKGNHLGERDKVKHPTYDQRKNNLSWSIHGRGAAGTNCKYHGKWVTGGGGLSGDTVFEGIVNELKDEYGVNKNVELKNLAFEVLNDRRNMLACQITDLSIFPYMNTSKEYRCFKELIFSSKGEIAEIRLVPLKDIYEKKTGVFKYNINCRSKLADYVENSFRNYYIPMFKNKGLI